MIRQWLEEREIGTFLRIGAHNGGWMKHLFRPHPGVFIEPVPYLYQQLVANASPHHVCLRCAVSSHMALERPFFYIHEINARKQPQWLTKIGSFSREHIVSHVGKKMATDGIVETTVSVLTLNAIRDICCLYPLNLLMIDAEGSDYHILMSADFDDEPPRLLIFEHKHMTEDQLAEVCEMLDRVGYTWIKEDRDIMAEL